MDTLEVFYKIVQNIIVTFLWFYSSLTNDLHVLIYFQVFIKYLVIQLVSSCVAIDSAYPELSVLYPPLECVFMFLILFSSMLGKKTT